MLQKTRRSRAYTSIVEDDGSAIPIGKKEVDLALALEVLFQIVLPDKNGRIWMELAMVTGAERGMGAYSGAPEITSLVRMERVARKLHSGSGLLLGVRNRPTMLATKIFDSK